MIFHSQISENRIQSFIIVACYMVIYHVDMQMTMRVLLHYLVLGREEIPLAATQKKLIILKRRPRRDIARSLYD